MLLYRQSPYFGKTQSRQKSFVTHTRRPVVMGNMWHPCHTRVSKISSLQLGHLIIFLSGDMGFLFIHLFFCIYLKGIK